MPVHATLNLADYQSGLVLTAYLTRWADGVRATAPMPEDGTLAGRYILSASLPDGYYDYTAKDAGGNSVGRGEFRVGLESVDVRLVNGEAVDPLIIADAEDYVAPDNAGIAEAADNAEAARVAAEAAKAAIEANGESSEASNAAIEKLSKLIQSR